MVTRVYKCDFWVPGTILHRHIYFLFFLEKNSIKIFIGRKPAKYFPGFTKDSLIESLKRQRKKYSKSASGFRRHQSEAQEATHIYRSEIFPGIQISHLENHPVNESTYGGQNVKNILNLSLFSLALHMLRVHGSTPINRFLKKYFVYQQNCFQFHTKGPGSRVSSRIHVVLIVLRMTMHSSFHQVY